MVVPVELQVSRGGVDPSPSEVDFGVLTSPSERRQASVSLFNRWVSRLCVVGYTRIPTLGSVFSDAGLRKVNPDDVFVQLGKTKGP